jgi:hypothetical protein
MSKLEVYCISSENMIIDLFKLAGVPIKSEKRLKRLELVFRLYGFDRFIESARKINRRAIKLAGELPPITTDDILKYFDHNVRTITPNVEILLHGMDLNSIPRRIKREIEGNITRQLNSKYEVYLRSVHIAERLRRYLCANTDLKELFAAKEIMFVYKGSMMQRLVLLDEHPEHADEINEAFKLGGDNDCVILINPARRDHDALRKKIIALLQAKMLHMARGISYGTIGMEAKKIKNTKINVINSDTNANIELTLNVASIATNHCTITAAKGENILTAGDTSSVYVSYNERIAIEHPDGRISLFSILRGKAACRVYFGQDRGNNGVVCGCEVLDIAIPHKKDCDLKRDFEEYRSGGWVRQINVPAF